MMIREIHPVRGPVRIDVYVPGSKSLANRALICASLAKGESIIRNASDSDDTALMANGLNQLGVLVRKEGDALFVEGTEGRLYAPKFPIPVGNAGTTLRFMISLAALAQGNTVFEGSERMAERPIDELQNALGNFGTSVQVHRQQSRFEVQGGAFTGGSTTMSAEKSSQFLSSLLMVAPYAKRDVTIEITGNLSSASYVELTLEVMKQFNVVVNRERENRFHVQAGQRYKPAEFTVEADASSASYFFSAAAICGGEVLIKGIDKNSLQGDAGFLRVLEKMGCTVSAADAGVRLSSNGALHGVDVEMNSMPDVVPTLAVTALFASSPTRIRNVAHLRHKESDRLKALYTELRRVGADIKEYEDGLEIVSVPLQGAQLDTYDDHRLAMSFALIGLKVDGMRIENPGCVKKSFPGFWKEFEKLQPSS